MRRLPLSIVVFGVLAAAALTWRASAQDKPDGPPPPRREGGNADRPEGRGGPAAGFHLIPRFVAEQLKLTEEQAKEIAELEKEVKAKLDKILTAEQKKILEEARPPRGGQGGQGGPGQGQGRGQGRGPGGEGGQGGGDRPPRPN